MTTSPPPTNPKYEKHIFALKAFNSAQLIKYPHLRQLYFFGPISYTNFDPQDFTRFCKGLATLKPLSVLHLNFSWTKQLTDQHLNELAPALRKLQNLTVVRLRFRGNYQILGEGMARLLKAPEKHRSLKELYLDFAGCGRLFPRHAESIYSSIRKMDRLSSLHLVHFCIPPTFKPGDLYDNRHKFFADEDGFADIIKKLKRLHHVKDLNIDFSMAPGLLSSHIEALSGVILRMPRLSNVSLNFGNKFQLQNAHFEILAHALKRLPQLQSLHLALPHLTVQGAASDLFHIVSQAFQNSQTLSSLTLDFHKNQSIIAKNLESLFLALGTLPNLSRLDLNFNSCSHFNDDIFKVLASSLANLKNLTYLKLNFLKARFLSGLSLASIADGFKHLGSLQGLELGFNVSHFQLGLPALFNALNSLAKQLSILGLELSQSKEFEDKDLKALAQVLKEFDQLGLLRLNLFSTGIGDKGLKELACGVQSMKKLQKLGGNFFGCDGITPKGIEHFKNCVTLNTSIKESNLNFPGSQQGSRDEKRSCSVF